MKSRIYEIMEKAKSRDIPSLIFDWTLVTLISLNVLSVILESFSSLKKQYEHFFSIFELVSVVIFTIEYFLRIWTSNLKYPRKTKVLSALAFIFSGMAIIDLLSILPFYIPLATSIDLRVLRVLRLTRMLRILKIGRYSASMALIGRVLKRSKSDLIVTLFVTFLLLLLASSLMYYVENPVQPDKFPNIVASAWWTIVTLTTVGYGDVYPITVLGKVLGGIIALLGIGLVALPTGIISSGFMEEIRLKNQSTTTKDKVCPHCGLPIGDN
ncbi:ion transporter [uncultured Sphaerochaeta sp.]|uniref:ion transporter n=1 Tax=uncultured Sphaerochaeta sp. TaxID=886478 RepID=UPI002A0A796C|nr:ion transporter [uncultured Sphaerochaeta sp.]